MQGDKKDNETAEYRKFKGSSASWVLTIVGVLLIGLIVLFTNVSTDDSADEAVVISQTPEVKTVSSEYTTPEKEKADEAVVIHDIKDVVTFGDYEINVKDVSIAKGNEEGSKVIEVRVAVKNTGKEPISVDSSYFQLYDQDERKFDSDDTVSFEGDPIFMVDDINPGLSLTRKVIFEVPDDVETVNLAMRNNMFDILDSADYVYIGLGKVK
ncbi:DUF4352 domain-containing protein [Paenibacillus xylanilyticus]|uniref:DUF4352 domain-containing protein n=1 Tax=Paenibacillus xylanilyticus TaxID=248903 RepID=A0A7Y6BSL9_9BACL|nr:DUF4352 domain-containing protein [Paenibacillus xylanilyticus]NUU74262.1 DUF4352 domain-containing protein [Paenibacillus xylanilyticus]